MTYTNADTTGRVDAYGRDREYDYDRIPTDLDRLENLDYTLEDGEPDPRGYPLHGRDGEQIGTIQSLLASPSEGRAMFAIVDSGGWFQDGKRSIIPLNLVDFDTDEEKAYAYFDRDAFQNAPAYAEGHGYDDYREFALYWSSLTTGVADVEERRTDAAGEIRVPVTEEVAEVRKGARRAGFVTVRKNVETETERISEPVTRTHVEVERREVPEGQAALGGQGVTELRDGETLRIPVVEETLEVETVPRVTEEVIVRATPETEQVEREVQLRREEVHVEREGDVDLENEGVGTTNRATP